MKSDILKMFSIVFKSLFKKSACDMYPVNAPKIPKGAKGHIKIDAPMCILCSLCQKKCPTSAIKVDREKHTWSIDPMKCILCNACVEVCPKKCLDMDKQYMSPMTEHKVTLVNIPEKLKEPVQTEMELKTE